MGKLKYFGFRGDSKTFGWTLLHFDIIIKIRTLVITSITANRIHISKKKVVPRRALKRGESSVAKKSEEYESANGECATAQADCCDEKQRVEFDELECTDNARWEQFGRR